MKRTRLLGVAISVAALVPGFTLGIMSSSTAGATPVVAVKTVDPPVSDINPFVRPHPVLVRQAAPAPPKRVTVASGDTLSSIAKAKYGNQALWPALWWVNKAAVRNPNAIRAGQVLKLSAWHPQAAWITHAALRAIPAPPARHHYTVLSADTSRTYHRAVSSGTYHGSGGMEACIIAAESGGNSQVMNSSGHYGLYQFSYSTWVASGGSPSSFGHASVAEQRQAFQTAVAARGYSDWTPYDPC